MKTPEISRGAVDVADNVIVVLKGCLRQRKQIGKPMMSKNSCS